MFSLGTFSAEEKKKYLKFFLMGIVLIALFSLFLSFFNLDPDFGWHLRTGQLIMEKGEIPHTDWYSFTLPNSPWLNHEWLSDIVIGRIYGLGGYLSLVVIFYFLVILPFYLFAKKYDLIYSAIPLFLGLLALKPYAGVRVQSATWLLIYLTANFFLSEKWTQKKSLWFFPLIFLMWANLHASFAIGLLIFGFAIAWEVLNKNLNNLLGPNRGMLFLKTLSQGTAGAERDAAPAGADSRGSEKITFLGLGKTPIRTSSVFLASIVTSLLNPYGYRIYPEILSTMFTPFVKTYISEWHGFFTGMYWPSLLYMALFVVLVIIFRKKVSQKRLTLSVIFLAMAISSTRHFPLFIIISIPLLTDMMREFYGKIDLALFQKIKPIVITFLLLAFILSIYFPTFPLVYTSRSYPNEDSINFLTNNGGKRIFSDYSWGGLLIWKLPESKFFIDGRMPHWRDESGTPMIKVYVDMYDGKGIEENIKKYNIDQFVLSRKESSVSFIGQKYFPKKVLTLLTGKTDEKQPFSLIDYFSSNKNWQEVYKNEIVIVFEKISN